MLVHVVFAVTHLQASQPRSLSISQHPSSWTKSPGSSLASRITPPAKILIYFPGWRVSLPMKRMGGVTAWALLFLPIQNILWLYHSSFWDHLLCSAILSDSSYFIQSPNPQFPDLYSLCAQGQGATNLLIGGSVSCLLINRRIQDMPVLFSPGVTEFSSQLVTVIASKSRFLLEDSQAQFWTFITCNMPCIHLPAACLCPQAKLFFHLQCPFTLGKPMGIVGM